MKRPVSHMPRTITELQSYIEGLGCRVSREGVTLSAGGWLDLGSLANEEQRYQGRKIRLRTIDGLCTRLISKRMIDEVTLWSAQYFKGHLDTDERCFVAQLGGTYAHGDKPETALRDLRFKMAQTNFDANDLADIIRRRGTVTFNDYRLITGACASGLAEGMRARGLDPNVEAVDLATVLELSRDGFGGAAFARAIGSAA